MIAHDAPLARIFVCINEKAPEKKQCLKGEGERIVAWLKEEVQNRGLKPKIKVTGTRCQGYCDPLGTSLTFVPTGKQYSNVVLKDAQELFVQFLRDLTLDQS